MNKLPIDFLPTIVLISEECRFQYVTCSNKSMALYMMGHISRANREIENINLEENAVKIMGPYNPEEPPSCLIEKLDKGQ